ncbi:hypothetical protein QR680_013217 [Steinernema hermaphroditum]|uniref:Uncharacterized protein n=1 Tax=Steinernema hermaphroditum TaxID=289476 RepID=A0AA39M1W1_9BILA|nr:hypothetical protein QR680_013217 [Steinernema hermaphroditum]
MTPLRSLLVLSSLFAVSYAENYGQTACNPCRLQPQLQYPTQAANSYTGQQPWYQPSSTNTQYQGGQYQPYGDQYSNQRLRDPQTPPPGEPGYLPDYRGDQFTNRQRIEETRALNKPFFDSIGGEPVYPGGVQTNQNYSQQAYLGQQPGYNAQSSYGRRKRRSAHFRH